MPLLYMIILKFGVYNNSCIVVYCLYSYWEAIKKWDEALAFTPLNDKLLEMKAQVNIIHESGSEGKQGYSDFMCIL